MDRLGISTALLTPFTVDGAIDHALMAAHALRVVSGGADGVTLFGTTGEGASIGRDERAPAIDAVLAGGLPAEKIVLGIAANTVQDAAQMVAEGMARGIADYLLLPPFYFKGCSDQGLFDWHAELFRVTDPGSRFILYHIPQVSGVALSVDLVGRLAVAAPTRVRAIKDSSGSWENAEALLKQGALSVLIGDERVLHRAAAMGCGGSINGMSNLYPERMKRLFETATEDTALSEEVTRIVSVPVVAALKAKIAEQTGNPGWNRLRPPLTALSEAQRAALMTAGKAVA